MAKKYYGFTIKSLIGFYLLIALVGYFVIFFVPLTSEGTPPITKTLAEILFFEPQPQVQPPTSQVPAPGFEDVPEMIVVEEPVSIFCRIYPAAESCSDG